MSCRTSAGDWGAVLRKNAVQQRNKVSPFTMHLRHHHQGLSAAVYVVKLQFERAQRKRAELGVARVWNILHRLHLCARADISMRLHTL
jgi:hypothetical protein